MITYTTTGAGTEASPIQAQEIYGKRRGRNIADLYRFLMCRQGGGGKRGWVDLNNFPISKEEVSQLLDNINV